MINRSVVVGLLICAMAYFMLAAGRQKKLKVGDKAPDFYLVDEQGNTVHLAALKGDVALAFFPSAQSLSIGCKKQMCSVRDDYALVKEHNISMFGLCDSSAKTLRVFARDNRLPFPLLHAPSGVVRAYGVRGFFGAKRRTFLIRDGIVVGIIRDVDLKRHAQQIVDGFKAIV